MAERQLIYSQAELLTKGPSTDNGSKQMTIRASAAAEEVTVGDGGVRGERQLLALAGAGPQGCPREGPPLSAVEWRAALASAAAERDDDARRSPARALSRATARRDRRSAPG